jgi:chromosome partitioning protein
MTKSIVFHSYKGGTGKTTLATNFAASLARKGHRVLLLDLDVYAPSLHSYFEIEPDKWINDFLTSDAEANDIMVDFTSSVADGGSANGKLWVSFCNPRKEEIYKLEGGKQEKVQFLRRFIALREELLSNFDADYMVIDTSPGIRYWSINSLAVADTLYLTLKSGDLDVAGTKKMAVDIYSSFTKFGAKSYLLLNKVAGYCVPHLSASHASINGSLSASKSELQQDSAQNSVTALSNEIGMNVISAMPCYCDIQFSKKEFLTAIRYPDHPFSKKIESLVELNRTEGS